MADRYTYIPLIGTFIMLIWAAAEVGERFRFRPITLGATAVGVLALCAAVSWGQVRVWKNDETVFRHAVSVTARNSLAHQDLGLALAQKGSIEEATSHFREAIRFRPDYPEAHSSLGLALSLQGNLEEGIQHYRQALESRPSLAKTHYLLANALMVQGKIGEAVAEYKRVLELTPDDTAALNDLAWVLASTTQDQLRDGSRAVALGEKACQLTGFQDAACLGTLAAAYAETGRFEEASRMAEAAIDLANKTGQQDVAARNSRLLELYRVRKTCREALPAAKISPP